MVSGTSTSTHADTNSAAWMERTKRGSPSSSTPPANRSHAPLSRRRPCPPTRSFFCASCPPPRPRACPPPNPPVFPGHAPSFP
eukprot:2089164-Rhodomonas_salina.1